ncbi:MAG: glycosyltransferase [Methanoregula sp.]|uniref:glycosyltransferase family protein n=1 Tax=Methanoregula sp. TaxID=2052170 RepID=UPI0025E70CB1|nr:glycosyltransferase family protein [Methanoregula sp.]MCK9630692.1 glycosyltransferase [Methanoregula sp.]
MKILFVVCGEGLGHASRCLHLGHYMQQQGHTIHYAGYGKSYDFMDQHGCTELHRIHREVCLEGTDGFFSLKKTLWHSKTLFFNLLQSGLDVKKLVRRNGYDCVVCDTMYAGVTGARLARAPVVFITNQTHFNGPNGTTNLVWKVLNILIRRYLRFARKVIIPDYPSPDTVSKYNIRYSSRDQERYCLTGPFFRFEPERFTYDNKTIFTSFGGEPYKLPMYRMLKGIADRRKDLTFDVFYTGAVLPESSDNFHTHGYVENLHEHLAAARIAIVHGGLTTLHEALIFEKPVLVIMDPGHPEQQNNAMRIVEMGAGTSVDGRNITPGLLEQKIAETMTIVPQPFRAAHAGVNGRQNASDVIISVAERGFVSIWSRPHSIIVKNFRNFYESIR